MKWLIASDIHGSAFYAQKLVEAFDREGADKMLLLGDILYHGPRNDLPKEYNPKKVIPMLNELKDKIVCVRGNCDAEVDQMVLEFSIMADYKMIQVEGLTICATHGHIYNEEKLPDEAFDVLLCGHTHVPKKTKYTEYYRINPDGFYYINPGSVSIPKEDSHHGYMILENGKFSWKDFDGNTIDIR